MAWLKRLLILLLIVSSCTFVLLFCLRNSNSIDVDLFFLKLTQVPVDLAIVGSFIFGGVAGVISSMGLLARMRKKYRQALLQAGQQK